MRARVEIGVLVVCAAYIVAHLIVFWLRGNL